MLLNIEKINIKILIIKLDKYYIKVYFFLFFIFLKNISSSKSIDVDE